MSRNTSLHAFLTRISLGAAWALAALSPTPPSGWSALQATDRSSWFIASVFTTAFSTVGPSSSWSFKARNLWTEAINTPPSWWTACVDAISPDPYTCGNL